MKLNDPSPDPEPDREPADRDRRGHVVSQQQNDDPLVQEQLTGEGVTAPDDTLGG